MVAVDLSNHLRQGSPLHRDPVVDLLRPRVHLQCLVEHRLRDLVAVTGDEEIKGLPESTPCFNNQQVPQTAAVPVHLSGAEARTDQPLP